MNLVLNNNSIINYSIKLTNFANMQETIEMFSSGFVTLLLYKSFIGQRIEENFVNFLGQKKGKPLYTCAVIVTMVMIWRTMDRYPRLNVNKLVNPYDPNGEIMLQIIMKYFPHKVNQKYGEIIMEKYGMNLYSNMGHTENYPFKLHDSAQEQVDSMMEQRNNAMQYMGSQEGTPPLLGYQQRKYFILFNHII